MAIAVATILSEANGRTGRAESDVNTFLKGVLHDLNTRGLSLEAEEEFDLVDDDPSYAYSGFTNKFDYIKIVVIVDSSDRDSLPLTEISWERYKVCLSGNLSKQEPTEYCIYPKRGTAKVLYLCPAPNATNYPSMKISGTLRHDDSTTISFNEDYRELLIAGVMWKIEAKYNVTSEKTKARLAEYSYEVKKIFGKEPTMGLMQYSDI